MKTDFPFRQAGLSVLLLFCFLFPIASETAAAPKFKVVALCFPDNNHAGTDTAGASCLKRLAAKDSFSLDIWTDKSKFTSANIMAYDLMVWVMAAPLSWSAANMTAFEGYIKAGKPWIGFHVAGLVGANVGMTWTWYEKEFFGTTFKSHPPERQNGTIHVDPGAVAHPVMKGVASAFTVYDEWWAFNTNPRTLPNVQVLATVDEKSYDPNTSTMGSDHPVAWTMTKFGRNLYWVMGHPPSIFQDNNFQLMIENAIFWCVNVQTGTAGQVSPCRPAAPRRAVVREGADLTFAAGGTLAIAVSLVDCRGRVVARSSGSSGVCRINRTRLGCGVYSARITVPGSTFVERVAVDN